MSVESGEASSFDAENAGHDRPLNPVGYDSTLLNKIDQEAAALNARGFTSVNVLTANSEFEYHQRLRSFKLALLSYLKLVGVSLYVHLRFALRDDPRLEQFLAFEKSTQHDMLRLVDLLKQARVSGYAGDALIHTEFSPVRQLIMDRYKKERDYLFPIYRSLESG